MTGWNGALLELGDGNAVCHQEGQASRPFPCISLPGGPPRPKGGRRGAGAGGHRQRASGLGAQGWALPTLLRPRRRGPRGPISSHLLRLQPRGRAGKGVGARGGPAGRKAPSSPPHSAPRREQRAAGCRSSVTFHESEVPSSGGGGVSSSRAGPAAPPRPRPSRPRPAHRPRPPPRASQPPGPPSGSAPASGARRRRRDFRPPGSRKMAAAAGNNPRLVFS